jgi:phosphoribosyl 1,2-cyclic phosphodiesterase
MCCTFHEDKKMDAVISDAVAGVPQVIDLINDAKPKRVILTHANPSFHAPGTREKAVAQIARKTTDCQILFPDERVTITL